MADFAKNSGCIVEPPRPCPVGNKAERTYPIIPKPSLEQGNAQRYFQTTYKTSYFPRELEQKQYFGPRRTPWKTSGEFDGNSLYKIDYPRHPATPFKQMQWGHEKEMKASSAPMRIRTTYNVDYQRKDGRPSQSAKPKAYIDPTPPVLDDQTWYKIQYVPHCVKHEIVRPPKMGFEIVAGCAPFDGLTSYKRDYVYRDGCKRQAIKPMNTATRSNGTIQHETVYSTSFAPYYFDDVPNCIPTEAYDQLHCSALVSCCEPEALKSDNTGMTRGTLPTCGISN